ncbi:MAG TPA: DUF4037 domain-containing protein, partial [Caldilineaceae bacterium]|nr:DUF4037 domain-containing protein [Caldilineaceae bacterium]
FDDGQSTDHDWGPRLQLFLSAADHQTHQAAIHQLLRQELPDAIHGYPTNMVQIGGQPADGPRQARLPIEHSVQIVALPAFFRALLRFDPTGPIKVTDWLSISQQALLMVVRGRVFYDGLGQLEPIRTRLRYYPHDLWLYLLAAQWKRIAQEEAFMGRCGQVGDELGSRLVASRLVRDLMRLSFLLERQYAPYTKWFGSAFAQLASAATLGPILLQVLQADSWPARETHLSEAYRLVAEKQNELAITPPLATEVQPYYNRPFQVIAADRFVDSLRAAITDPDVLALPAHLGAVDQFIDSTDAFNSLYNGQLMLAYGTRSAD